MCSIITKTVYIIFTYLGQYDACFLCAFRLWMGFSCSIEFFDISSPADQSIGNALILQQNVGEMMKWKFWICVGWMMYEEVLQTKWADESLNTTKTSCKHQTNFEQFVKLSCWIVPPEHAEKIINIFISFRINQNKSVLINPPQQRLAPEPLGFCSPFWLQKPIQTVNSRITQPSLV